MSEVTSKDGTLCSRAFGASAKLARSLADRFTVLAYDHRGRGQSGDALPYAPAREVEDLAALVVAAVGAHEVDVRELQ